MTSATSGSLTYTYLSDGTKVSAIKSDGSGKRYVGSMVYSVPASGSGSETIESAAWDEGRVFFNVEEEVDSTGAGWPVVDSIPGLGCYRDCWYVTDHLGNVRTVVDVSTGLTSPQVVERNDYLPFGTRMSVGSATLAANRYRLGGKEEQAFGGLDLGKVDFGARMFDPFTARWTTQDPMAAKYAAMSPYSYCAGNPVNYFDYDGNKIFFVNGYKGFGSPEGGKNYWNNSFVSKAKITLKDNNVQFLDVNHSLLSSVNDRYNKGYQYVSEHFKEITQDIEKGETISFVSHSMGAAYSEGMAQALIDNGYDVRLMVHIAPYQAAKISTIGESASILTIDFQTLGDPVISVISPGSIKGADKIIKQQPKSKSMNTYHREIIDNPNSWTAIKDIIEDFLNNANEKDGN